MALIEWLQTIAPPALIHLICPLLVIVCFLLAFDYCLYPKWRTAAIVYSLSLVTSQVLNAAALPNTVAVSGNAVTLIKDILVPTLYSLLFVLWGSARSLHLPYDRGVHSQRRDRSHSLLAQIGYGAIGGTVGGMIGVALGALFGFATVALTALLALFPIALSDEARALSISAALNSGISLFGILGVGVGMLVGLGYLNLQQTSQKLLIYAVIYSAMTASCFSKLLKILPRSGEFEVTEGAGLLRLRHRTYRRFDWVWIGFNGLYDLFALLVMAIALLRGSWVAVGTSVDAILLLGLVWTWYSLSRILNHTTITLSANRLTRFDTPFLSFNSSIRIPLWKVAGVRALTRSANSANHTGQRRRATEYHVYALLTDGKQVPLLKHLDRWEEALFVEERVSRFLTRQ
jgi:hypothetical protein